MATTSFQPSYSADIPLYRPLWTPPVFDIYPNDKPKVLCIRLFARERYTNKTSVYQGLRKVAVEALCHENNQVGECTLQYGPWQRSGEYVSKEGEWQRGIFDAVRFCTDYNLANGTKYPIHIMLFDFMSPTVAEEVGPWMEGGKELNLPLDWTILCDSVSRVNVASLDIFTFDLKKLRGLTSQQVLEGNLMTPNLPEGVQAPPLPCYVWRYENLQVHAQVEAPAPNEPTEASTSRKRKAKVDGVAKRSKMVKTEQAPDATHSKRKQGISVANPDPLSKCAHLFPLPPHIGYPLPMVRHVPNSKLLATRVLSSFASQIPAIKLPPPHSFINYPHQRYYLVRAYGQLLETPL
ncbi:hypothetical protein EUX98_g6280 [Antrodiella citrinella]|uniref:Uncharacterized protein n=1 Tax=Antrodiella citrinella TaxID=2447956 RepID=A0A4S4MR94_9APHY|nr:hypothetical protein EUX98_g6280 [Antrodiella citrinella]